MTSEHPKISSTRRRGGLAVGLDRTRIVAAARSLPADSLTMQAVADRLGVDRKALHHHVSNREGLLELVASDVFQGHLSNVTISRDDWRLACKQFAEGVVEALLATGDLSGYFVIDSGSLRVVSQALTTLQLAGFDDQTAQRGLHTLATVAMGNARDRILAARFGEHPQNPEVRRALADEEGAVGLPALTDSGISVYGSDQLRFDLDLILTALELRLTG